MALAQDQELLKKPEAVWWLTEATVWDVERVTKCVAR